MKKIAAIISVIVISMMILFTACEKTNDKDALENEMKNQEVNLFFQGDGDFEKVITKPLVRIDGCKYIVAGTIEYRRDGAVVTIINFGNGECDNIATKTVDGVEHDFKLDYKGDSKYTKIIVEPLVGIETCDFIVSGIIKFYQGDKWVATIDYGNGECDDLAIKYWEGGSKEFSLKGN
ncbi:MAG: hypothetical protein HQ542_07285 [Bacteroidia bacterium]|nr:hypothetical protein [Bacteroidia bacterium]